MTINKTGNVSALKVQNQVEEKDNKISKSYNYEIYDITVQFQIISVMRKIKQGMIIDSEGRGG